MPDSESTPRRVHQVPAKGVVAGLMLALLAWGIYLAIGAYQAGLTQHTAKPIYRGLIVFGFTALFLAFWGVMLLVRRARQK